ncbi:DUF6416 domain-containing protein [Pseudonocardia abyssalis]|jgi:hypothetical protein|uniref:Uncharacterized protein n=1 Tax=Pseudonocardia abyssalis TaxID=2792008 RepID=A0ABS6UZ43_9PSEU|nr:DUF6416 domain-containing protein [Pseudonocardia abyssalis]MBW0116609.1 hypothetical protein [Pseudonocardia abyssalis]MBW0137523.1 hypothetical protein [Pseudonocardia abyssalis]
MIDITVKVPEDRVPEFYSMYGTWLNSPAPVEPLVDLQSQGDAGHLPWTDADADLAAIVWDKLSDTAKGLFSALIDNPEQRFSGDELSEMLRIPNGKHGVAGVLAWPGRHCAAVNRTWPWSWSSYLQEGTPGYWFTPDVAQLFRDARDR